MWRFGRGNPNPPSNPVSTSANPFDSDSDSDNQPPKPSRYSSEPTLKTLPNNPFDDDDDNGGKSSSRNQQQSDDEAKFKYSRALKDRYKNGFRDQGGLENQSVQELENYAVYKSEETTDAVSACLKIAEDIRDEGTKTMVMLHQQGEQITRTHMEAVRVDQDLSKGEKLLGSLGGIFSMPWKPKKTREITGPVITLGDNSLVNAEQRDKPGTETVPKGKSGTRQHVIPTTAQEKIEFEKAKQDDALNDLSNLLGDLKGMALDMGSEIERQNQALDHLHDDIDELNSRMKGANARGRRLAGK